MTHKIGFFNEQKSPCLDEQTQTLSKTENNFVRPSVVRVYFEKRHLTCTYYNDTFTIKEGDFVYVEGKLEGLLGRVVSVSYSFKINLADYKRIIAVADTTVHGTFFHTGTHLVTTNRNTLPYEQIRGWFLPPISEETVFARGRDEQLFSLDALNIPDITSAITEKGRDAYRDNALVYFEIDNTQGRALFCDEDKVHEIEFSLSGDTVCNLTCDCYQTGICAHAFAAMLQVSETLEMMREHHTNVDTANYVAAVFKPTLFQYTLHTKTTGTLVLD